MPDLFYTRQAISKKRGKTLLKLSAKGTSSFELWVFKVLENYVHEHKV